MVDYLVSLGIFTAIFALFSLGLNLQWGYTGLINFGQVAFLGLGAYTTILLGLAGVPLPLCVLAGAILAALLGLLIGISTLRLREDYLAIVTIGVAEVLQRVALNEEWLTRGARGVYGYPLPLDGFKPNPLLQSGMSVVLVGIFAMLVWRLWQWLPTRLAPGSSAQVSTVPAQASLEDLSAEIPTPEIQPTETSPTIAKIPGFIAYLLIIFAVEYSFWYWLPPLFLGTSGLNIGGLAFTVIAAFLGVGAILINQGKRKANLSWRNVIFIAVTTAGIGFLGMLFRATITALANFSYKAGLLWLLIVFTALVFWQLERWVASPWGRVLKAIREDEEVPRALGKNVFSYKLQSFMLGGALTGLAGAFYAWQLSFVEPKGTFDSLLTFQAWTIVVLGGAGSNVGTLLGAGIFWAYNAFSRQILPALVKGLFPALAVDDARLGALRVMLIGLLLVVMMMWRPQGMLGKKEELTLGR
jgi:neutral amino acid transport system permease protein